MNIKQPVQNIIKVINITLAMGFVSYLHAEQPIVSALEYNTPYSGDVASLEQYSYQAPSHPSHEETPELFFKEHRKSNEDRAGSFLYKTIDDPEKVRNQIATSAILYGLDAVGLGDSVREGIYFIKRNTRYSFGDCGNIKLKPGQITADSCLSDGGSVEFNSSYDFNSVQLQFKWPL